MDSTSVIILICGVVALLLVIGVILFVGSRRKASRAGTSHTTPATGRPTSPERTHRDHS